MKSEPGSHQIESLEQLRKLVPAPPAMMDKRLQPRLDAHCLTMLKHAVLCVAGFAGRQGFAFLNLRDHPIRKAQDNVIELVWTASRDLPEALAQGERVQCSLYFVLPGIGFTMRANGACGASKGEGAAEGETLLQFQADAFFLHCSRAKVRADFWTVREGVLAEPFAPSGIEPTLSDPAKRFIAGSPYLLALTENSLGDTEISPRGDPAGFVRVLDDRTLLIPERPGNRVACTMKNILDTRRLSVAFLQPGRGAALIVDGRAVMTADPSQLGPASVNGKAPKLGALLSVERCALREAPELVEAGLWSQEGRLRPSDIPSFAKMLAEHMQGKGLLGKATTLVVDSVVKRDLKNLY